MKLAIFCALGTATLLASATGDAAAAASGGATCANYPYGDGVNVEDVAGGTKILATSTVTVTFDDVDSVKDARTEATMEAKSLISKFMSEDIASDEKVTRTVQESKVTTDSGKSATRKELIDRVKSLRNTSRALLRGVVPLGECYTPGRELRVSVGIKPETIASAGRLASGISQSLGAQPTPGSNAGAQGKGNAPAQPAGKLQNVDGYSNTDKLKTF